MSFSSITDSLVAGVIESMNPQHQMAQDIVGVKVEEISMKSLSFKDDRAESLALKLDKQLEKDPAKQNSAYISYLEKQLNSLSN